VTPSALHALYLDQFNTGATSVSFDVWIKAYRELDLLYQDPSTPVCVLQALERVVGACDYEEEAA
jgi:hypothetical protein